MKHFFVAALSLIVASGCGVPSFLITPVQNPQRLEEQTVVPGSGFSAPKIALIEVEGMISNLKGGGLLSLGTPGDNPVSKFVQEMDLAAKDPAVKAVVLRVNSPGGTVTASDIMYQTVARFKQQTHKPVVASLQDLAASGAYYVACGADRIVTHPTSVVGSIGVIFNTFNVAGTMEKIGAKSEAIKSGPLKDMASPFREIDPASRAVMQAMVDEFYGRFVSVVTTNRPIKADDKTLTDGRVFSGARAVELGLADQTGLLDDAIEQAKQLSKAPNARVVTYRRSYGHSGSIYADANTPTPQANVTELKVPGLHDPLPSGFYYLWQP
jgi:protease-4